MNAASALSGRAVVRIVATAFGLACVMRILMRGYIFFKMGFSLSVLGGSQTVAYAFFAIALLGACCVLVLVRDKADRWLLGSRMHVVLIMAIATVMCWVWIALSNVIFNSPLLAALAIAVFACLLALAFCAWGCILYRQQLIEGLYALALSPLFMIVLQVLAVSTSAAITHGIAITLLGPAALLAYDPALCARPRGSFDVLEGLPKAALVVFACGILACSVTSGLLALDEQSHTKLSDLAIPAAITVAACAALFMSVRNGSVDERKTTIIVLVAIIIVIAVLFVAVAFSMGDSSERLPNILLGTAKRLCIVGSFIIVVQYMHKKAVSPTLLASLLCIVDFVIPMMFGRYIIPTFDAHANELLTQNQTLAILCVFTVLVCVTLILLVGLRVIDSGNHEDTSEADRLEAAYETVAKGYGLTNRELEVMRLIAEGNSMKKVGETLFISLGTVQTHAKNIYRKLDIHSRQELLDLIEQHK